MRAVFTVLALLVATLVIDAPATAGDLSRLRDGGGFRVGPSDYHEIPAGWRTEHSSARCRCGQSCYLDVPELFVYGGLGPRGICGVTYLALGDTPGLSKLTLRPYALVLLRKTEAEIIREYGNPTHRKVSRGVQLFYCTDAVGRVDRSMPDFMSDPRETYEYAFGFNRDGKVNAILVEWRSGCSMHGLDPVP